MTLGKLLEIATEAYGNDGVVLDCFNNEPDNYGDTLAQYVARELKDTYDPAVDDSDQLLTAMKAMRSARDQLDAVIKAFSELL